MSAAAWADVSHVPQNRPQRVVFKAPLLTRRVMIDFARSSTDVFIDEGKSAQTSLENSWTILVGVVIVEVWVNWLEWFCRNNRKRSFNICFLGTCIVKISGFRLCSDESQHILIYNKYYYCCCIELIVSEPMFVAWYCVSVFISTQFYAVCSNACVKQ